MKQESLRQSLFTAIEEGNFDRVPGLATEYAKSVRDSLADGGASATLLDFLEPLLEALAYLRIVRAHQSAQLRRLSRDALYRRPAPASKGRTLDVEA